jgi:hypothetical protein
VAYRASRGASATHLYCLDAQHDPWRAASHAWRAGGDDNGLLAALEAVDLLFEFGDLLLSLGQGTRRIRNLIDRNHQTVNQQIRLAQAAARHARWLRGHYQEARSRTGVSGLFDLADMGMQQRLHNYP